MIFRFDRRSVFKILAAVLLQFRPLSAEPIRKKSMITARFYDGMNVSSVASAASGAALPTNLWVAPGNYVCGGQNWDMHAIGLYRFWDSDQETCRVCLVWDYTSIDKQIAALTNMHMDGSRDEITTVNTMLTTWQGKMPYQRVSARCGFISDFLVAILHQYAPTNTFASRKVQVTTATPHPSGDNGHVIFEEKSNGSWRLWDSTNGEYFTDASGSHLSLKDIINLGMPNCNMVQYTTKAPSTDAVSTNGHVFDWSYWNDFGDQTEAAKKLWCNDKYQIPAQQRANGAWVCYMPAGTEGQTSYMQGLGFVVESKVAWETEFYS